MDRGQFKHVQFSVVLLLVFVYRQLIPVVCQDAQIQIGINIDASFRVGCEEFLCLAGQEDLRKLLVVNFVLEAFEVVLHFEDTGFLGQANYEVSYKANDSSAILLYHVDHPNLFVQSMCLVTEDFVESLSHEFHRLFFQILLFLCKLGLVESNNVV